MIRGVVIGKFYPPHNGHQFLIEKAKSGADHLAVIVCHRADQKIPGELRAAWIREMVPGVSVIVVDDCLPEDDSKAWADYTAKILGYKPEVVFTSEDYGETYARYLGARHVLVDKQRTAVPISATQIRQDPLRHWKQLAPCVRGYFAKRVCILGAESTGTTTMAAALAKHYDTVWVPEFGREYYETKMRTESGHHQWRSDEFVLIANQQNTLEDNMARVCNKILFCDTDSFATHLWHERYMKFLSPAVRAVSRGREPGLYLLTDVDIPFTQDGTRDGESIRHGMHDRFQEELEKNGKEYHILTGSHEKRMKKAIALCDAILKQGSFL